MFKVGDIVWAKESGYSMTFYHRPCKVLSYNDEGMCVRVIDSGRTFIVYESVFELVPEGGILNPGDKLIHKKSKEMLVFTEYDDCDFIKCRDSHNEVKQFKIQEVERFREIFYV
jgi:hypothetical protein